MQYRILGKTGLMVSAIGFGTWSFANDPDAWVGATKKGSERSLLTALDAGINFIDTARIYGNGLAEQWLGEVLSKHRYDTIIATKMYPLNQEWSGMKGIGICEAYPKKHIIEQVDESLRVLKRDTLDIMYFHVWEDEWARDSDWQETISELTRIGKVKNWGISTNDYDPTNCLKACETGLISVVMTIFNLFYQKPILDLFPKAKELNLGLVSRVPLDEGGLTGKFTPDTTFPDGDFRQNYFSPKRLLELQNHTDELMSFVDGKEIRSLSELALRFILSFDEVASTIPGMRKVSHVRENTHVADLPKLDRRILKDLGAYAWNRNFYD